MTRWIRELLAWLLLLSALAVLAKAVLDLGDAHFVRAIVDSGIGLSLLGASMELLRPSIAE